jgi:hypothetical protein
MTLLGITLTPTKQHYCSSRFCCSLNYCWDPLIAEEVSLSRRLNNAASLLNLREHPGSPLLDKLATFRNANQHYSMAEHSELCVKQSYDLLMHQNKMSKVLG